jgi:hypothetical protein
MTSASGRASAQRRGGPRRDGGATPLIWTFDGRFANCIADLEDALRRAIVQIGDVSRVAVAIDVSLPALEARVAAGDRIQPAWGDFVDRVTSRYGLPATPRLRYLKAAGPLLAMVIAYRS